MIGSATLAAKFPVCRAKFLLSRMCPITVFTPNVLFLVLAHFVTFCFCSCFFSYLFLLRLESSADPLLLLVRRYFPEVAFLPMSVAVSIVYEEPGGLALH